MTDRTPDSDYTPFKSFTLEPANEREVQFGSWILKLAKGNGSHLHSINPADALKLADTIYATLCGQEFESIDREEVRHARARIEAFLNERRPMLGLDPHMIVGANHQQLLVADIELVSKAAGQL